MTDMTRDDIIRIAREAHTAMLSQGRGVSVWNGGAYVGEVQEFCERFAALVAKHEREACVKACKEKVGPLGKDNFGEFWVDKCVAAIRARGESK
jgi:hypothetical protein